MKYILSITILLHSIQCYSKGGGYNISIKFTDVTNIKIYLAHYYGSASSMQLTDSSVVDKNGNVSFRNNDPDFVGGIYIILPSAQLSYFDFILNAGDNFKIICTTKSLPNGLTFSSSLNNTQYREYIMYSRNHSADEIEAYRKRYIKQYPNTFLAKIFMAMSVPNVPSNKKRYTPLPKSNEDIEIERKNRENDGFDPITKTMLGFLNEQSVLGGSHYDNETNVVYGEKDNVNYRSCDVGEESVWDYVTNITVKVKTKDGKWVIAGTWKMTERNSCDGEHYYWTDVQHGATFGNQRNHEGAAITDIVAEARLKYPYIGKIIASEDWEDTLHANGYFCYHYWDKFNFQDDRLLFTPIYRNKLDEYINKVGSKNAGKRTIEFDMLLRKTKGTKELYRYTLGWLIENAERRNWETEFVYLVGNYLAQGKAPWMTTEQIKPYIHKANKIFPGYIDKINRTK